VCVCVCVCVCARVRARVRVWLQHTGSPPGCSPLQGMGPGGVFLPLFSAERQGCALCSDPQPAEVTAASSLPPRLERWRTAASSHPQATPPVLWPTRTGRRRSFTVRLSIVIVLLRGFSLKGKCCAMSFWMRPLEPGCIDRRREVFF